MNTASSAFFQDLSDHHDTCEAWLKIAAVRYRPSQEILQCQQIDEMHIPTAIQVFSPAVSPDLRIECRRGRACHLCVPTSLQLRTPRPAQTHHLRRYPAATFVIKKAKFQEVAGDDTHEGANRVGAVSSPKINSFLQDKAMNNDRKNVCFEIYHKILDGL